MIRLKSQWIDCDDRDKHVFMSGESDRLIYLDSLYINGWVGTELLLWINGVQIAPIWIPLQLWSRVHFYYILEHPLFEGDSLVYQQREDFPGGADMIFCILYHDLPPDVERLPDSYPYPPNPNIPPFPYIPVSPTPTPSDDVDPPEPIWVDDPPIPDGGPFPLFPPITPDKYKDYVAPDFEDVPDFKPAIPVSILKKNALVNAPYVTSRPRFSFLGDSSFARRPKLALDYQKTFSHLIGEGIFQSLPLRASETAQLITTNVKDDYRVIAYEHTDALYHNYFFELPFTHLTLKPGAADWKLKILTVYKWLSRFSITDMDEISLDADKESFLPFYAIGFSVQCPTATVGTPQTISGMVEF